MYKVLKDVLTTTCLPSFTLRSFRRVWKVCFQIILGYPWFSFHFIRFLYTDLHPNCHCRSHFYHHHCLRWVWMINFLLLSFTWWLKMKSLVQINLQCWWGTGRDSLLGINALWFPQWCLAVWSSAFWTAVHGWLSFLSLLKVIVPHFGRLLITHLRNGWRKDAWDDCLVNWW